MTNQHVQSTCTPNFIVDMILTPSVCLGSVIILIPFVIGRGLYPTSLASTGTTIPILLKHLATTFLFLALMFFDSPVQYPSSLHLAVNFLLNSLSLALADPVFNLFETCKLAKTIQ